MLQTRSAGNGAFRQDWSRRTTVCHFAVTAAPGRKRIFISPEFIAGRHLSQMTLAIWLDFAEWITHEPVLVRMAGADVGQAWSG